MSVTAPAVVNATSTNTASGTSSVGTAPASLVRGNLLLAVIHTAGLGSALVQPTGWTLLKAGTGATNMAWKLVDGSEPSTWTWTWTTAAASANAIVQISGNNIGLSGGTEQTSYQANASSANITAAAVTAVYSQQLLLTFYCDDAANTITLPGGQSSATSSVGNSRSINVGYETLSAGGSTGTRVATATAAVNRAFIATVIPVGIPITIPRYPRMPFPQSWQGLYKVAGTTKSGGVPARRWVWIAPRNSPSLVLASRVTGDDGVYSFNNIPAGRYIVSSLNPDGSQDAVIHDYITAVPV